MLPYPPIFLNTSISAAADVGIAPEYLPIVGLEPGGFQQ